MIINAICFSKAGRQTGLRIQEALSEHEVILSAKSKLIEDSIEKSLSEWTAEAFAGSDCLVFIGSCGIAVRAIAPYIGDKAHDPAVIVVDERGNFAISLLSGHLGGANEMAEKIALAIDARPVITTATDVNGFIAPDVFARDNDCSIDNLKSAKNVAAALVDGDDITVYTDMEITGALPENVKLADIDSVGSDNSYGILVSEKIPEGLDSYRIMWIIPKTVYLGIGCRRGTDKELISQAVSQALAEEGLDPRCIAGAASVTLKADEAGLLEFCAEHGIEIEFYSPERLMELEGDFSSSEFVKSTTGVDCVCERSALAASGEEGMLVKKKSAYDKVTVALAVKKGKLNFE